MQRARARDTARQNLSALGDELLQRLHVLEIDVFDFLDAEFADAFAAIEEFLFATLLPARTTLSLSIAGTTPSHLRSHQRSPSTAGASGAAVGCCSAAAGNEGGAGRTRSVLGLRLASLSARL